MTNKNPAQAQTPEQLAAQQRIRKHEMSRQRPFRVGDHVELARRVLEEIGHLEDGCSRLSRMDQRIQAVWKDQPLQDGDDESTSFWTREDFIGMAAAYSGRRIVDEDGERAGVVRLTWSDLCGIADCVLELCKDWWPEGDD